MQSIVQREANLLSRLERMPLNGKLLGIVAMLAWCWVMEAFDLGIVGQVVLVLKQIWTLEPGTIGLLGTCSTAGVVIGTMCAGFLTDRFGRRRILLWGVFIFTFFTLIGAIYTNIAWIVTMRFLGGLGAGAVFPLPYLMLAEIAPAKHRGMLVCVTNAILTFAYFLPTWCGAWAIKNFSLEVAWRVPFVVGGLPILTLFLLYKLLPESPRWLMQQGRHDEVQVLVEDFEKCSGVAHDEAYVSPTILAQVTRMHDEQGSCRPAGWKDILTPPLLSRSLVSWGFYTAGLITWYVIMVYVPTILNVYGFEPSSAVIMTGYMMIIGGMGAIVMGFLTDRFGRKLLGSIYVGVTVVCLIILMDKSLSQNVVLLVGALAGFFGIGVLPVCKVYIAEQYPTELRGVGTGMGEAVARILGGVLATYYFAFFMSFGGLTAVFIFMALAFSVTILALWIWGTETARKSVEEAAAVEKKVAK